MKEKIFVIAILTIAILCAGCDGDDKVDKVDGALIIDLPPEEKLVNFTSSYYGNYVIHRKRHQDEYPEEYTVDAISRGSGCLQSRYAVIREH